MYFPTQEYETYRLLGLLGDLQIDYIKERYLKEYFDIVVKKKLENQDWIDYHRKIIYGE